ncbi:MAG: hypothetical protein Q4F69_02325 [Bacteroidia bacterium]|nr:hypothetical protein [Bacteroidia bacterium]
MMVKKVELIVLSLVFALGFSQCRKPVLPDFNDFKTQPITFTTGNRTEKGDFNVVENGLKYKWASDDKVYVYSSPVEYVDPQTDHFSAGTGVFCGVLNLESGSGETEARFFSNYVKIPKNCKTLRFIHFRKDGVAVTETKNENGEITSVSAVCDLSQQNGELTGDGSVSSKVIAYCDKPYENSGVYSGCALKLPYAIFKIDLSQFTNKVYMSCILQNGVNVAATGQITGIDGIYTDLNDLNADYYVVVMPLAVGNPIKFSDDPGSGQIKSGKLPVETEYFPNGIEADKFYHGAQPTKDQELPPSSISLYDVKDLPAAALPGVFTVAARKSVHFAKGNYWYRWKDADPSNPTAYAGFENNQYNYRSNHDKKHVATFYWSKNGNYGAGNDFSSDESTEINWGDKIGGGVWSTLTYSQWVYIFSGRPACDKGYYKFVKCSEVNGVVILPDNKKGENPSITTIGNVNNANAIFLPAGGYRSGDTYKRTSSMDDPACYYWSSNPNEGSKAYAVRIDGDGFSKGSWERSYAFSVRLVCE